ncbi:hypothetical protein MAPG_11290 [Magnaporthiopsis poae ATCC 64411]|uniref:Uncharacterized protein n=1 Tax=Magnaporthiopsis poae (strain ATCC 64411 / 73-15) TaxID=644358 RepID=A0A0C4EEV8_MAGP6|nr:hypothetical protein MAPG_11290 [Magnaporthiopsis poae ATCC 64411]
MIHKVHGLGVALDVETAVCLALATITSQVAAAPLPKGKCTDANPCRTTVVVQPKKEVNAGMIWFPGAPGSKHVIDDALGKIFG